MLNAPAVPRKRGRCEPVPIPVQRRACPVYRLPCEGLAGRTGQRKVSGGNLSKFRIAEVRIRGRPNGNPYRAESVEAQPSKTPDILPWQASDVGVKPVKGRTLALGRQGFLQLGRVEACMEGSLVEGPIVVTHFLLHE